MSRSRRKTSICSVAMTEAGEQKEYKKQEHKRERRSVNAKLKVRDFENLPDKSEFGNEWSSPRDGKQYFNDKNSKEMRK